MWVHLSALLTSLLTCGFLGFLPPLLFLNHNNRCSAFVDFHAKQSLNHQLTCLIIYAIGTVIIIFGSALCCLGLFLFIPLIALLILSCVLEGLATMQAQNGQWIRLPVSFPFVS